MSSKGKRFVIDQVKGNLLIILAENSEIHVISETVQLYDKSKTPVVLNKEIFMKGKEVYQERASKMKRVTVNVQ